MNLFSAPPELRLIVGLTATAAVAALALMPHRAGLGLAHAEAGFPITYATWRGRTVTEFSVGALAIDVALLLVVAGFGVWRYWAVKRDARLQENAQDVLSIIRREHERLSLVVVDLSLSVMFAAECSASDRTFGEARQGCPIWRRN